MSLGAFRLNTLSAPPAAAAGARASAATFTASAGPSYTATNKFGGNSIETTNTTSRKYTITVNPTNASWYLNTSNIWTIEFFSNAINKGSEGIRRIFGTGADLDNGFSFVDPVANGTYQLDLYNGGTRLSDAHLSNGLPDQGVWYHWALVSDGTGNIKLYSNGTQRFSGSSSLSGTNRTISFGHTSSSGVSSNFAFDEVRISNITRYTAAFSPPTAAFDNDANTLALFHFNGDAVDDETPPPEPGTLTTLALANNFPSIYNRSGDTFTKLTLPDAPTTNSQSHIKFNHNGTSVAITNGSSPYIHIYNLSGNTLTKLSNPGTLPPAEGHGVAWNHDGTSLAVAHDSSPFMTIYNRSGNTFTKLSNPSTLPGGSGEGIAWNHDGTSLAVGYGGDPSGFAVYNRSGNTFTRIANFTIGNCYGMAWNHDGTTLALANFVSPYIHIYNRSGDTFTKLSNPGTLPTGVANACAWNHDGTSLAVVHSSSPYITIYNRSGDTFTKLSNPATLPASTGYAVDWNHNGTSLTVSHASSPYVTTYNRTGDTFTKIADIDPLPSGSSSRGIDFTIR
jgi:hypothetical protein